jgi:hypothetical protein
MVHHLERIAGRKFNRTTIIEEAPGKLEILYPDKPKQEPAKKEQKTWVEKAQERVAAEKLAAAVKEMSAYVSDGEAPEEEVPEKFQHTETDLPKASRIS